MRREGGEIEEKQAERRKERLRQGKIRRRNGGETKQNSRISVMWSAAPEAQSVVIMIVILAVADDLAAAQMGSTTYGTTQDKFSEASESLSFIPYSLSKAYESLYEVV